MQLYVTGDSHSCGHDAGGIAFSYGQHLSNHLKADLICAAKPGASNDKIIRTTLDFLDHTTPDLIVIGWSTWEREEWYINDTYYDVSYNLNTKFLPKEVQDKYKQWLLTADFENDREAEHRNHENIWIFHNQLTQLNIPHLFFNCYNYFRNPQLHNTSKYDWGDHYIGPYNQDEAYYFWLESQGFKPVNIHHYGPEAHRAWANHLITHLTSIC